MEDWAPWGQIRDVTIVSNFIFPEIAEIHLFQIPKEKAKDINNSQKGLGKFSNKREKDSGSRSSVQKARAKAPEMVVGFVEKTITHPIVRTTQTGKETGRVKAQGHSDNSIQQNGAEVNHLIKASRSRFATSPRRRFQRLPFLLKTRIRKQGQARRNAKLTGISSSP